MITIWTSYLSGDLLYKQKIEYCSKTFGHLGQFVRALNVFLGEEEGIIFLWKISQDLSCMSRVPAI